MPRIPTAARTPLALLVGGLAVLALLVTVPAGRAFLVAHVIGPLGAQATGAGGGGYSGLGLAFWALAGAWLASVAWTGVVKPLRVPVDLRLAWALAPFLAWGPLAHALLQAGAFAPGSALAWLTAEPLVYATTGALAVAGLAAGALAGRERGFRWPPAVVVGAVALLALAPGTWRALDAGGGHLTVAAGIAAASVLVAVLVAVLARGLTPLVPGVAPLAGPAGAGVVGAHALDGLSTWVVLRDPFGIGLGGFEEKNPFADALVSLGNGWLFPTVKILLAAGLFLLAWQSTSAPEDRPIRAPALLALFVLGWGPGASNLLILAFGS